MDSIECAGILKKKEPMWILAQLLLLIVIGCKRELCFLKLSELDDSFNITHIINSYNTTSFLPHIKDYDVVHDKCNTSENLENVTIKIVWDDVQKFTELSKSEYLKEFINLTDENSNFYPTEKLTDFLVKYSFNSLSVDQVISKIKEGLTSLQRRFYKKNRTVVVSTGTDLNISNSFTSDPVQRLGHVNLTSLLEEKIENERREIFENVFERCARRIKEFFGFYEYDNEGRRAFPTLPAIAHAIYNYKDYQPEIKELTDGIAELFYNALPSTDVFKDVSAYYHAFTSREEPANLVEDVNDLIFVNHETRRGLQFFKIWLGRRKTFVPPNESDVRHAEILKHLYYTDPRHHTLEGRNNHPVFRSTSIRRRQLTDDGIFDLTDVFTWDFWAKSTFSGFHMSDGRVLRPLNPFAYSYYITHPMSAVMNFLPSLHPSDQFAFTKWAWNWFTRSNTTRSFIPELDLRYKPVNESMCLSAFPYLPDPRKGCEPPTLAAVEDIATPEDFVALLDPTSCIPYTVYIHPVTAMQSTIQIVLTRFSSPLFENGKNPLIRTILVKLKLIHPSGVVPGLMFWCILPQIFITLALIVFGSFFIGSIVLEEVKSLVNDIVIMVQTDGGKYNTIQERIALDENQAAMAMALNQIAHQLKNKK